MIGVPVSGKNLGGLDALLSAVQMPPGVPVACVAIDAPRTAAARRPDDERQAFLTRENQDVIPRYTREEMGAS